MTLTLNAKSAGLVRDLNPGPLAPKARIIPLDQRASAASCSLQQHLLPKLEYWRQNQSTPAISYQYCV